MNTRIPDVYNVYLSCGCMTQTRCFAEYMPKLGQTYWCFRHHRDYIVDNVEPLRRGGSGCYEASVYIDRRNMGI